MKLLDSLALAVRTAARDLFGEEDESPNEASRPATLLKTAQARLDALNEQLAQAVAREKRAEQAWQDAVAQASVLDDEVNAAVRAGQDDMARFKLAQLKQAKDAAQKFSITWQGFAVTSEKLRIEIQDMQAQLAEARRRMTQIGERENNAIAMEGLHRIRREQRAETTQVRARAALQTRDEQAAQREDNIAAREELDQARIVDLLKKRKEGQ